MTWAKIPHGYAALASMAFLVSACNGGPSGSPDRVEALRSRFAPTLAPAEEPPGAPSAEVSLPPTARGAFSVRDTKTGMSVEVALTGTTDAPGSTEGGLVVYRGGYAGTADVLHRAGAHGAE